MKKDAKTGILYREWESASPEAVLLLVHGLGAHTGRWEFLAEYFLRQNISSYAIELRGFGETEGVKGHIDSVDIYFSDIRRLSDIAKNKNSGKKIFLIGESIGALIAFPMIARDAGAFSGLVCISPAFSSRLNVKAADYVKMFLPLLYNPKKQFAVPFTSEMCTRDVQYQRAMNEDPREHRLISSRLVYEITMLQAKGKASAREIRIPALFLLAGEDRLVDPAVSRDIFDAIGSKEKKIIEYPEMFHALSIDVGREGVFSDISAWVKKTIEKVYL